MGKIILLLLVVALICVLAHIIYKALGKIDEKPQGTEKKESTAIASLRGEIADLKTRIALLKIQAGKGIESAKKEIEDLEIHLAELETLQKNFTNQQ